MRKKIRVIVVDDEPIWLELFTELLHEMGLDVISATSYADAVELLNKEYFHILVSDMRLVDDDESNKQGLEILSYIDSIGLGDVITKIMATGYGGTFESRQSFIKYKVHDFIPKQGPDGKGFDEDDFKSTIRSALKERIKINIDLDIEYVHGLSPETVASKIKKGSGKVSNEVLLWELDDLIRKLFPDATKLIIFPVSRGHSKAGFVKVDPFYKGKGLAEALIVKYGSVDEIEQEAKNFQEIKQFTTGKWYTNIERQARTRFLGGLVYSLIGKVRSFGDFYPDNNSSLICDVLDDLYNRICRKWYENRNQKEPQSLLELYWLPANTTYENLLESFTKMYPNYTNKDRISFPDIDSEFVNPIYHPFLKEKNIYLPVYTAITHGDLHDENLLIDRDNHTWLIDFSRTGNGHIFRDFIALETTIKFQLLTEYNFDVLYEFEKAILAPNSFTEKIDQERYFFSPDIQKTLTIIKCLREFAGRVIQPSVDIQDYYAGLFYQTLNLIRYYHIPQLKKRKLHLLLSASLLCEKLEKM